LSNDLTEVNCSDPGAGENVARRDVESFLFMAEATFLCIEGYIDEITKSPSVTVECQANRSWSRPAPNCICMFSTLMTVAELINLVNF